ncbi:hypothetical protein KUTeg_015111 [Tegillarca granosa]|uniref:Major facilitator superfamily (MFS) profile domain-containing protein n=1 Tax=Tegillarca granosa TaxID=220873 RepID=A0ABQ9EP65_TEGGR|nr:hypothetical protein KUTeg_015111 [Tegillarca granosa]
MPTEIDSDDSDVGDRSPARTNKYKVRSTPNPSYNVSSNRDIIDSFLSNINKDLLICKLFYFFFFAAFGSLFPLLAIYFKQLGMNPTQSGILIGFRPFVEFLSAPFWGGIADKYKKGKQLFLLSLFCWVVFTFAIAFVKPPPHHCVEANYTSIPPGYVWRQPDLSGRRKRNVNNFNLDSLLSKKSYFITGSKPKYSFSKETGEKRKFHYAKRNPTLIPGTGVTPVPVGAKSNQNNGYKVATTSSKVVVKLSTLAPIQNQISQTATMPAQGSQGVGDYIRPRYSTIYYEKDAVQDAFFTILLLVVIGEFFSAPAITFADAVTLNILGEDTENYGRQRMFGSLGWALAMFFVGLALDQSTTFPNHPCGIQHLSEKNYVVCFAVFSVLMSCAFITGTQFKFSGLYNGGKEVSLIEYIEYLKDKVMELITGERRVDRSRLFDDADEDIGYLEEKAAKHNADTNTFDPFETKDVQQETETKSQTEQQKQQQNGNGKGLQISLQSKQDMVTDVVKNSENAPHVPNKGEEEPFMGKWLTVIKMLGTFKYISVLFVAWFMGFGIGLIFTFLFWHLQDLGGSPTLFGIASVFNHLSELLAYLFSKKLISAIGHINVLYAGLLGNVGRFLYISFLDNPWWVLPFEFVQGLTHAAVWAACCSYITQAIPLGLRSSAQGILQGLHHGLGRGCGAVFGGMMVYGFGSRTTFCVYGIVCLIILILYFGLNYFLRDRGAFSHGGVSNYGSTVQSSLRDDNFQERNPQKIMMDGPPLAPTQIYQQQPFNSIDQRFGP